MKSLVVSNWEKCQIVPKSDFQSQFSLLKIILIFLIFFSLKNASLEKHFSYWYFLVTSIFKWLYFLKWCPIFDSSNSQNAIISFNCSWFLAKNLSNFVSLPWKLHNRYCHTLHEHISSKIIDSDFISLK